MDYLINHTDNKLADVFADSVLVLLVELPTPTKGVYPLIISEVNFLNSDSDFSVSSSLPFEVAPFSTIGIYLYSKPRF